ncbi:TetR/AcrR family transcriptional regulator [Benzoatithermus flavus]|uniref:TetR/AcrR family transcriptional regulator n=1 Tax=Benzoatithermus flavus TaxID=3108223 RepID=A0ABU8Y0D5_9PROT
MLNETREFNFVAVMTCLPASPSLPDRRRRILDAAARLFAAAPYEAVQMDDIARAAQVAKPTVYRHFETKETLFVEAIEAILAGLKSRVAAIARESGPPAARLRALVRVMFAEIGRLKALIRIAEGSATRPGDAGRAVLRRELRQVCGEIAAVIREGVASGAFADVEPELAAMVVLGGVRMAADSGSGDPAEAVANLLLAGLAPRGPAGPSP